MCVYKSHAELTAVLTLMCATLLFILCITALSLSSSLLLLPSEPLDLDERLGALSSSACVPVSSRFLSGEGLRCSSAAKQVRHYITGCPVIKARLPFPANIS